MIGGDKAVKEPWRMALSWLYKAGIPWIDELNPIKFLAKEKGGSAKYLSAFTTQFVNPTFSVPTSSMGRLFDAVASIIGIRQVINYEAQAAIELEAHLDPSETGYYEFTLTKKNGDGIISPNSVLRNIVDDTIKHIPTSIISARFHNGLARMILDASISIKEKYSINNVVFSGGVWQNVALLQKSIILLKENDFNVYTHSIVPPNDGGVSLGQALIAASKIMSDK